MLTALVAIIGAVSAFSLWRKAEWLYSRNVVLGLSNNDLRKDNVELARRCEALKAIAHSMGDIIVAQEKAFDEVLSASIGANSIRKGLN